MIHRSQQCKLGELLGLEPQDKELHKGPITLLERRPDILAKVVDETRRNGQWILACEANKVSRVKIGSLLDQGRIEYDEYEDGKLDELSVLGDFYICLKQAQALHAQGVIDEIHGLARSGGPEYKHFYLWIIENLVEGKPYARFQRVESKSSQQVVIINQQVTSDQWRYGIDGAAIRQKRIESGDIIDTTTSEIQDF